MIKKYNMEQTLYKDEQMNDALNIFEKIEKWGEERNFYNPEHGTTSEKQFLKLSEEVGEIAADLARGINPIDSIGDVGVVLIGLARLNGLSFEKCLEYAYNEIKDRKGEMRNGVFVKEQDL